MLPPLEELIARRRLYSRLLLAARPVAGAWGTDNRSGSALRFRGLAVAEALAMPLVFAAGFEAAPVVALFIRASWVMSGEDDEEPED